MKPEIRVPSYRYSYARYVDLIYVLRQEDCDSICTALHCILTLLTFPLHECMQIARLESVDQLVRWGRIKIL